jgi:hypothetical protein
MRGIVSRILGAAAAAAMLMAASAGARAEMVSFVTDGVFASSNSNTYTNGNVTIKFTGSANNNVTVPPASSVTFGQFDTSGTTATSLTGVSDTFTLSIFEIAPDFGQTATFLGTLTGSIRTDNSQAYVQFNAPLSAAIGNVLYSIVSADFNQTLGTVRLSAPTVNSGLSTIAGLVNVVPEPSSVLLCAIGAPIVFGLVSRTRKAARKAA